MNIIKKIFSNKKLNGHQYLDLSQIDKIIKDRTRATNKEFAKGYNLIKRHPRSVSILGSARFGTDNIYYKQAESLGRRIATDLKYAVVTGGGPGIMEAANKGAFEAGGVSLGFNIKLPKEQEANKYLTDFVEFEYFFSRKTILFFSAEAYVYYPGGFGTMDELFEILTLIQTGEIPKVPVILFGSEFWKPLMATIKEELLTDNNTIDLKDTYIYKIVDTEDEIVELIKKAPIRLE